MLNSQSGGRLFPEEEHIYRTPFQRDRDRIVHSRAFRRLGYKTQVFNNSEGDNYRTRLTHSIEVAQVARSVAAALRLNRDYAECLALAHDLGHAPFGHAGQDALHSLMLNDGGFEHNCQSMRIVQQLEHRYLDFEGLNLTRATLKGMLKHCRIYTCDEQLAIVLAERKKEGPSLEAAIVDLCDQLTYTYHDLEDGLDAGFLELEELRQLEVWKDLEKMALGGKAASSARAPVRLRAVLRLLLHRFIEDLIQTTAKNVEMLAPGSLADIIALPQTAHPVQTSAETQELLKALRQFLFSHLYRHAAVLKMSLRGENIIRGLFHHYAGHPEMLSHRSRLDLPRAGTLRVVCDYVAGMTDRFALKEFAYLQGVDAAVL
jgi:dGTPase